MDGAPLDCAGGAPIADPRAEMARDFVEGLSRPQKMLPPKWLYDARGSSLFEEITQLPEYYQTRTELEILRCHAAALTAGIPDGGALIELGSGASTKTRLLLEAGPHIGAYVPIDISESMLTGTVGALRAAYPDLKVLPVAGDFTGSLDLPDGLATTTSACFFPGSTIGNLEPSVAQTLLQNARFWPGVQRFILGVDLVKDPATLVAAYDDAQGVTAAFILNILARANAELGAGFDVGGFTYKATWDAAGRRVDMWLISTCDQVVRIEDRRIAFDAGEPVHVSAARKYTRASLTKLAKSGGWGVDDVITDPGQRFAVAVLTPEVL